MRTGFHSECPHQTTTDQEEIIIKKYIYLNDHKHKTDCNGELSENKNNNVTVLTTAQHAYVQVYTRKVAFSAFSTCSDFDRLWCEPPVDIIDEYAPLLFCQIQPVQNGGITEK